MASRSNTPKNPPMKAGQKFGRLTAVAFIRRNNEHRPVWRWLCDCGNEHEAIVREVIGGSTKSCGCWKREHTSARFKTHGMCELPEYNIWARMVQRCTNPNAQDFDYYGGRGIKVCDQWLLFENFYADTSPRPLGKTIDRVDNNGPYSPSNFRWATRKEQARNRRNSRFVEINGERMLLIEAIEKSGLGYRTVMSRLNKGWSDERALTVVVGTINRWST